MTSDQTPAAPTVVTAAVCVFNFSVGKMLWSRRTIFLALVPAGPVALGLVLRVMRVRRRVRYHQRPRDQPCSASTTSAARQK